MMAKIDADWLPTLCLLASGYDCFSLVTTNLWVVNRVLDDYENNNMNILFSQNSDFKYIIMTNMDNNPDFKYEINYEIQKLCLLFYELFYFIFQNF